MPNTIDAVRGKSAQLRFRRAFLAPRYWLTWLGLGTLWLLTWLPWPLRSGLAVVFGDIAHALSAKRRRIADANLRLCFAHMQAHERRHMIRQHFRYKARVLLDYPVLWWGSKRRVQRLVSVEGEDILRAHLDSGRAVILFTPHSIALDFGATRLSTISLGAGVFKPVGNPLLNWLMARGRTRFGGVVFARKTGLLPVVRVTRAGAALYYLSDEDLGERDSTFVPFFGEPAATLATLGRLARACNAVALPMVAYYVPRTGRYVTHVLPALVDFPSASAAADAARMNQSIETLIRLQPAQYLWTMKRFRTRPPGAAPVYD